MVIKRFSELLLANPESKLSRDAETKQIINERAASKATPLSLARVPAWKSGILASFLALLLDIQSTVEGREEA